ncbi:MAG: alanine racemase [Schleiferiaceae bacterium]|nr:alanine racemase [Schleiferiaceae bacterium]
MKRENESPLRRETVLRVSLPAIRHNLHYYQRLVGPSVGIMAMVKALSYGAGAYPVARCLVDAGASYLGVAYPDEGIHLRERGIQAPILVLNPLPELFPYLIEHQLEPEIYSRTHLKAFEQACRALRPAGAPPYPVHLKLETGMNRLGFTAGELPELKMALPKLPHLRVRGVMSHLAAADLPEEDAFTRQQIDTFHQHCQYLREVLPEEVLYHLANSPGTERFPAAHFDMVRLGYGLYGVSETEQHRRHLKPVSRLTAPVAQVKPLRPGDTVSYGRRYQATEPTRIAVISMGYADGFGRELSAGKGEVAWQGYRFPVVGTVCMDFFMVVVGDAPVQAGDEVEIFGPQLTVYEAARQRGTIPYEVITRLSPRVRRVYLEEEAL